MQRITPCLWFDSQAEDAANFYISVFKNSKIGKISRYGESGPGPAGGVLTISFELDGVEFTALNGGPHFKLSEAVSMVVNCTSQEEVDHYWDRLGEGGEIQHCGWLKDRFGLSWQIVPDVVPKLLSDPDPARTSRVMAALLKMIKLDVAELEKAAAGE